MKHKCNLFSHGVFKILTKLNIANYNIVLIVSIYNAHAVMKVQQSDYELESFFTGLLLH